MHVCQIALTFFGTSITEHFEAFAAVLPTTDPLTRQRPDRPRPSQSMRADDIPTATHAPTAQALIEVARFVALLV